MTYDTRAPLMRTFKPVLIGLALISIIPLAASVHAAPATETHGFLVIEDLVTDKTCKIDLSTAQKFIMRDKNNCDFGYVGEIWLEHAASATSISFVQESPYGDRCAKNDPVYYPHNITIKTAGYRASTEKFSLLEIKQMPSDQDVVVPGVRVTHADYSGNAPGREVMCLFITPSPRP